jgi:prepilin-type N-terminal cleavage/methylation domain-containing protein
MKGRKLRSRGRGRAGGIRAFTLLELMVAMAVFLLLAVLLASMVGNVSTAWTRSREKMDTFAKGRALMNHLQQELKAAVFRDDLAAFPGTNFAFYTMSLSHDAASLAQGPADARSLSFVSYANGDAASGRPVLSRTDKPYFYAIAGSPDAPLWIASGANAAPSGSITRQLCEGVYRFRWAFVQENGEISDAFSKDPANPTRAVQVSLVVLSEQAEDMMEDVPGLRTKLEDLLDQVLTPQSGQGWSPKTDWDVLLESGPDMQNFPSQVRNGIRTYERVIPVQNNPVDLP